MNNQPLVIGVRLLSSPQHRAETWLFLEKVLGFERQETESGADLGVYIYSVPSFVLILDSNVMKTSPEVEPVHLYISVPNLNVNKISEFVDFWGLESVITYEGDYVHVYIPEVFYFHFMFFEAKWKPGEVALERLQGVIKRYNPFRR